MLLSLLVACASVTAAPSSPASPSPVLAAKAAPQAPVTVGPIPADRYPDLRGRDTITVLVLGDTGEEEGFTPVANAAAATCYAPGRPACDLSILVGDNVYEVGIQKPGEPAWVAAFATPMAPFVPHAKDPGQRFRTWVTAGNHDWNQAPNAAGNARVKASIDTTTTAENHAIGDMWQFPALVFEVPGLPDWLHLHSMDTETIVEGDPAPIVDATKAAMAGETGWQVVFGHHFPVSTGRHAIEPSDPEDEHVAAAYEQLRASGLDLVLAGHDHHQELLETVGIPVAIQGNSSKGRELYPSGPYKGCSKWARGGAGARGYLIATFTKEKVHLEWFDATGEVVHDAEYEQAALAALPRAGDPIGTCPKL